MNRPTPQSSSVTAARCAAVVQARSGSSRLPRKVLRSLGGRPVLEWVVTAARSSGVFDAIVVATTEDSADDEVAQCAAALGATVVRGPVDDVLTRYLMAIDTVRAEIVARLTADCPLLDPSIIRECVQSFDPESMDYLSTNHPRTLAHGFDVEVVSADALRTASADATGAHRAHVTSYLYTHPDQYRVSGLTFAPDCSDLRVTLDEPADAELLEAIVAELGDAASDWRQVVSLLRARPDLVAINAAVRQKSLEEG